MGFKGCLSIDLSPFLIARAWLNYESNHQGHPGTKKSLRAKKDIHTKLECICTPYPMIRPNAQCLLKYALSTIFDSIYVHFQIKLRFRRWYLYRIDGF